MSQEPIDEFLKRAIVERKQLSDQEREDAMSVAREVWKKAIEKANGKEYEMFFNISPESEQRISLFLGQKVAIHKPENPKTDLVIMVSESLKDEKGNMALTGIVNKYFFAPNEVVKKEFNLRGVKPINSRMTVDASIGESMDLRDIKFANPRLEFDPNVMEQARRQEEQRTEETYHPDKADLSSLLSDLSSAKATQSSTS